MSCEAIATADNLRVLDRAIELIESHPDYRQCYYPTLILAGSLRQFRDEMAEAIEQSEQEAIHASA